jgi:hypothetical protein
MDEQNETNSGPPGSNLLGAFLGPSLLVLCCSIVGSSQILIRSL